MRRLPAISIALTMLAACSGDHDDREAAIGESAEVDEDLLVEVRELSVETYESGPYSQTWDPPIPAITAEVRSENRGTEDAENPLAGVICTDPSQAQQGPRAAGLGVTFGEELSTWLEMAPLPPGSSDEGVLVFIFPGQAHIGDPLPDTGCEQPVLRFMPQTWGGDGPPTVDVPIPESVIDDYVSEQTAYQTARDAHS